MNKTPSFGIGVNDLLLEEEKVDPLDVHITTGEKACLAAIARSSILSLFLETKSFAQCF